MKISISEEVSGRCSQTLLGVLRYEVQVWETDGSAGEIPEKGDASPKAEKDGADPETEKESTASGAWKLRQALTSLFEREIERLSEAYALPDVAKNPQVVATRVAYKALGKAPQEYRNSAEAMLRRIAKGNGLYRINTIVDIGNLISVTSGFSLGSYEVSELEGDITLRRAPEGTHYDGIGKSSVNIGCLPVLYDEKGPFGNPTSDSRRAMIREGRRDILSVVYSFGEESALKTCLEQFSVLLREFGGAGNVESFIIRPGQAGEVPG